MIKAKSQNGHGQFFELGEDSRDSDQLIRRASQTAPRHLSLSSPFPNMSAEAAKQSIFAGLTFGALGAVGGMLAAATATDFPTTYLLFSGIGTAIGCLVACSHIGRG